MKAFMYSLTLQFKLDIRSKSLLVTCYIVPLVFFAIMGLIFTSIMPESKETLIQSMTIMGVSMGAFLGLPPSMVEIYGSDIKKVYKANCIPMYVGALSMFLSAFIHLLIMSTIIYFIAPIAFKASIPNKPVLYFIELALFIITSLSIGTVLGLSNKQQSKLTMIAQLVFLPSIMLSGIMFSADLLPSVLSIIGKIFPATWAFLLMTNNNFINVYPLLIIFVCMMIISILLFKKCSKD